MMHKMAVFSAFVLVLVTCGLARAAETLNGTWTTPGTKGAIVLTLKPDKDGHFEGTLKGGQLSLVLNGFTRPEGGVLGTVRTPDGAMASYFVVVKQGDKVLLDLIELGVDGDPDPTKKQTISFSVQSDASQTPATPGATSVTKATASATNEGATATDVIAAVDANSGTQNTVQKSFVGTFAGDNLTLQSRAQGPNYVGTVTMGGRTFPFTGTIVNGTLHGTLDTGGEHFDFRAQWNNATFELSSGDATYKLQKLGGTNPLARPRANAKNPLNKASKPAPSAKPAAFSNGVRPVAATTAARPAAHRVGTGAGSRLFLKGDKGKEDE
ncbi:MAG: hypothetical protein JWN98_48 [Abditibacteriota bacterium]|jgi:hypothetical protein|nr:hypothetical protein [Abditibacteriota bacterium]